MNAKQSLESWIEGLEKMDNVELAIIAKAVEVVQFEREMDKRRRV